MDCILNKVEVDATNKVYCDKELAEANQKKSDKVAEIKKLVAEMVSSLVGGI